MRVLFDCDGTLSATTVATMCYPLPTQFRRRRDLSDHEHP